MRFGIQRRIISECLATFLALYPTTQEIFSRYIPHRKRIYALYPTTQNVLFHCIPKRRKLSSVLSNNAGKSLVLYPSTEENLERCLLHTVRNNVLCCFPKSEQVQYIILLNYYVLYLTKLQFLSQIPLPSCHSFSVFCIFCIRRVIFFFYESYFIILEKKLVLIMIKWKFFHIEILLFPLF